MSAAPDRLSGGMLLAALLALGACSVKSTDQSVAGSPSDWRGVWVTEGAVVKIDGYTPADPAVLAKAAHPSIFDPDIQWNDAGRKKVAALMAASPGGDPGFGPTGGNGWGYPLMMTGPSPVQFVVRPDLTIIVNMYRDLRLIYTDGRGHLPAAEGWPPTTWGDSVGHWEDDTLVIDTIQVRDPYYMGITAPFSDHAHYLERLRKTGPDRIEGQMTIEDPVTLAKPLTVKLAYVHSPGVERMVMDSFSNNRTGFDGEFNTIEPPRE